ncbi:GNAT family N-acetyltransferase [Aliikangiella marina]|uniref:GNAT family N-acetyltransferase n=1 Tax=Aliikangiella marina TaxID=1712262 RepID=A0A545T4G4_9GAMM|nr:GNAT family N-acetyltransferase [Aliikangiella marina]TQV72117.1 GNAT family N-acetyltransferase [Aliikangiella marina]
MHIAVYNEENSEIFETLVSELRQFNMSHMDNEKSKPLSVIATDDIGKIIGGVSGRTIYNQLLIEILWISESARGSGLGTNLMLRAESEAKARGCIAAQVDTLSFQAPKFYQKLGFEIVGKVADIPNSPERFFLVKRYS